MSGDSREPSAVADVASGQRGGNTQGPIASTLRGPATVAPGDEAQLELQIDRRALHQHVPVEVQLRLPPQVVLEQGAERTVVAPSSEPHALLRFVVRPLEHPRQPLLVVVDAHGDGFGYHAELPYHFAGQTPPASAPVRAGGAVRVGRRHYGQSVPVKLSGD
jgi:hypothetical protein